MNVDQYVHTRQPENQIDLWRELQRILAEWREAERRLAGIEPGSVEHARAAAEVARLRDRYQRTYSSEYPGA